jgi:hypothetical protein
LIEVALIVSIRINEFALGAAFHKSMQVKNESFSSRRRSDELALLDELITKDNLCECHLNRIPLSEKLKA